MAPTPATADTARIDIDRPLVALPIANATGIDKNR
jgi:hypothetical protein